MDIIARNPNDPMGKLVACSGHGYCLVYAPSGKDICIDVSKMSFEYFDSQWFNPQNGKKTAAEYTKDGDYYTFDPPGDIKRGNDWVLILSVVKDKL